MKIVRFNNEDPKPTTVTVEMWNNDDDNLAEVTTSIT
jgi:hypothetical protein